MDISNETYVKTSSSDVFEDDIETGVASKKASHPTYLQMAQEAITKLAGRSAVSRIKIANHIKDTYGITVGNQYLTKALKALMDEKVIENTSGNGAMGSFKLTKDFKEQQKQIIKTLSKKKSTSKVSSSSSTLTEKEKSKEEESDKTKSTKRNDSQKKDDKPPKDKKKDTEKGKENKKSKASSSKPATSTKVPTSKNKEMKILKEKINTLTTPQEGAEDQVNEIKEAKQAGTKKRARKAVRSSKLK